MQTNINELKKTIEKNFGKKCKDYAPFCTACIIWHAYETIKKGLEFCEILKPGAAAKR